MPTFINSQPSSDHLHLFGWKAILRTAVFSGICAAATASFGQYNVTVFGDGAAHGATSDSVYGVTNITGNPMAATWNRTTDNYTNQNPAGASASSMFANSGELIGGSVNLTISNTPVTHAYIWDTSAGTSMDVNPAGALNSDIIGMGGQLAAGALEIGTNPPRAAVWDLSNGNQVTTLDEGSLAGTFAYGTDGVGVVGFGFTGYQQSATYWATTSSSVNILQVAGAIGSTASAISGNIIVGDEIGAGYTDFAYEWNATTLTGQALNSSGFMSSMANGTNGTEVVGYGFLAGTGAEHALVWNVASNSYTDLNGGFDQSAAFGIDAHGDVFGYGISNGVYEAVEWTPQAAPEPSGLLILGGLATLGVVFVRRK